MTSLHPVAYSETSYYLMDKLTVHIVDCPIYSYKLSAEGIHRYRDWALEAARDLYLDLYEKAYRRLMSRDFNPLWTPDTKSENDLDFKDDFGRVSYFYFNVCLLKILSDEHKLHVIDKTTYKFKDQKPLYQFLGQERIEFETIGKDQKRFAKHKIKRFILETIRSFPKLIRSKVEELNQILSLEQDSLRIDEPGNVIYLYVHSVGNMSLKSYLDWRYSDLLELIKENQFQAVIVSTIDFEDSDNVGFPFVNINRLVPKFDLLKSFLKSVLTKGKVLGYVASESLTSKITTEKRYFLKNLPRSFFYPIRELYGLEYLFKEIGPGLMIAKDPVNNKGASSLFYKSRKHGVRVLLDAPRMLTPVRFSNQFIRTHTDNNYPDIYPHSMIVYDRLSYETIAKQLEEIQLYPLGTKVTPDDETSYRHHNSLHICLVLQKKKEIEEMVEEVLDAIHGMDLVSLKLKMHPTFPIPDHLNKRYQQIRNVQIWPLETSLEEAIQKSDLCITSYSTAALGFAKVGKPVVWLKNATLNSLFFTDLQKRVGLIAEDSHQLREFIERMTEDSENYKTEAKKQHAQIKRLLFEHDDGTSYSLNEIINEEFERIS